MVTHTCIVSIHLAARGNNKILRTPPPHIISSEEILPRLTCCTRAQFRTNKSPFLKSYLHKVDDKTHPSPLFPLCNTHTQNSSSLQLHPHTHHIFTPGFVDIPRRGDCTAGWWTTSGKIGFPHYPWEWVDNNINIHGHKGGEWMNNIIIM